MANLVMQQIITNNKDIIIFDTHAQLPTTGIITTVYYVKADETNNSLATSYTWDGTQYVKLSDITTDLAFYDTVSSFPSTGQSVDTLYVLNGYQYIYQWDTTISQYTFIKQATSLSQQMMNGTLCQYANAAILPVGISLAVVYKVGSDSLPYLISNGNKIYFTTERIKMLFTPISGQTWDEIIGNNPVPPEPIVPIVSTNGGDMKTDVYDPERTGTVTFAQYANFLNGKTGGYYDTKINNKVLSATFSATQDNTTHIVHNLTYDPIHDLLQVIDLTYNEIMSKGINYTENNDNISIDLLSDLGGILQNEKIQFILYKGIK